MFTNWPSNLFFSLFFFIISNKNQNTLKLLINMNCQFRKIQFHIHNFKLTLQFFLFYNIFACLSQDPKIVHTLKPINVLLHLRIPLFCTVKFPMVWMLSILPITSPMVWFNRLPTLPTYFLLICTQARSLIKLKLHCSLGKLLHR